MKYHNTDFSDVLLDHKDNIGHKYYPYNDNIILCVCYYIATSLPSMTLDKIKPQTSKSQTQLSRSLHQVADWLANQSLDTDALSFTAEGNDCILNDMHQYMAELGIILIYSTI